jgi:hypothetical protein
MSLDVKDSTILAWKEKNLQFTKDHDMTIPMILSTVSTVQNNNIESMHNDLASKFIKIS